MDLYCSLKSTKNSGKLLNIFIRWILPSFYLSQNEQYNKAQSSYAFCTIAFFVIFKSCP